MLQPVVLLSVAFLLRSCEAKGAVIHVFAKTGQDLFLDLKQDVSLEGDTDFIWKFNDSHNIVKYTNDISARIHKSYQGRTVFSAQNFSLLLNNVAKTDSGHYTAHVSGDDDSLLVKFTVTVQDPVSPVKLRVKSTGSCNLTVTCSAVGSDISSTATCDNRTCSEATTYPSSISIYVEQGFVICNHSNHVSWEQDKKDIKTFCEPIPVSGATPTTAFVLAIVIGCAVLALFLFIKYLRKKRKNPGNTIYAVPQNSSPDQTRTRDHAEDPTSPTSTYSFVQFPKAPSVSTMNKKACSPETIYAQVNRSAKNSGTTKPMS
ncbi:natural killer cell receptor 2B4-like [Chelmon rostratus]|uniref:natural killer cell receptor 2B4-like n=1 Tax=Chelmon rostratus TaxID=109905 RepID=UPI001BEB7658|nr:natural killer cell receptor 2B4-like [Chelmon rostratus]